MASIISKPKVNIDIDTIGEPFYSGSTVPVKITVSPQERFSVRLGVLGLTCTEVYWQIVSTGKSTYHQKRKNKLFEVEEQFLDATNFVLGMLDKRAVDLILPEGLPPKVIGKTVNISWQLKVSLDIVKMRDINEKRELRVLPITVGIPMPELHNRKLSNKITAYSDDGELILSLSSIFGTSGETIKGSLEAKTKKDISFREIRIVLEKKESAGSKSSKTIADLVILEKTASLGSGHYREWLFKLKIPENPTPTVSTEKSSVVWSVRGIIDKPMKGDFSIESPIRIY